MAEFHSIHLQNCSNWLDSHLKFGHFLPAATLGVVVITITLGVKDVRSTDLAPHFVLFGPSTPILEVKEVKLFQQFVIPPVRSFCL